MSHPHEPLDLVQELAEAEEAVGGDRSAAAVGTERDDLPVVRADHPGRLGVVPA